MKKVNYLFILFAIAFAFFILSISLQSASKSEIVGNSKLMSGKFYVGREILPDHSIYPLLMIVDRIRLELADTNRQIILLSAYGDRRLFYTKKLLDKGNSALAAVTLSKAIKYTNQALEESITLLEFKNQSVHNQKLEHQPLARLALDSFNRQATFFIEHRDQFSNEEKVILTTLSLESSALAEKLRHLM